MWRLITFFSVIKGKFISTSFLCYLQIVAKPDAALVPLTPVVYARQAPDSQASPLLEPGPCGETH